MCDISMTVTHDSHRRVFVMWRIYDLKSRGLWLRSQIRRCDHLWQSERSHVTVMSQMSHHDVTDVSHICHTSVMCHTCVICDTSHVCDTSQMCDTSHMCDTSQMCDISHTRHKFEGVTTCDIHRGHMTVTAVVNWAKSPPDPIDSDLLLPIELKALLYLSFRSLSEPQSMLPIESDLLLPTELKAPL